MGGRAHAHAHGHEANAGNRERPPGAGANPRGAASGREVKPAMYVRVFHRGALSVGAVYLPQLRCTFHWYRVPSSGSAGLRPNG